MADPAQDLGRIMARIRRATERAALQAPAAPPAQQGVSRETNVAGPWTAGQEAQALALAIEGDSVADIAAAVGRSEAAVRSKLCRLRKRNGDTGAVVAARRARASRRLRPA